MKALLVTLSLLLVALAGIGTHWAAEHYRDRPRARESPEDPRLKFRSSAFLAREAAERYRALPPNERRTLRNDLLASLSDLDRWSLGPARRARLVCLGERHHDATRNFIATQILPLLDYRVLMLETGEDGLADLEQALIDVGQAALLGARIDPIMTAVGRSGLQPRLAAIDENALELRRRQRRTPEDRDVPSREETLARKTLQHWQAGGAHVVLMGALHCRDTPDWLFHRLIRERGTSTGQDMLSVVILARSQETGARLLYYLLEEMDIRRTVLVIPDTARFPHQVQSWLPPVADAFAGYRSAILFDDAMP